MNLISVLHMVTFSNVSIEIKFKIGYGAPFRESFARIRYTLFETFFVLILFIMNNAKSKGLVFVSSHPSRCSC